jgi:hypothetical protein
MTEYKMEKNNFRRISFWSAAVLIYITVIFTTCIHFAYGPDRTIDMDYYFSAPYGQTPTTYSQFYPDKGSLHEHQFKTDISQFWKLTCVAGDASYYLLQVKSLNLSIAPYKYRFLPTLIVGLIAQITGWSIPMVFMMMNFTLTLITALLFTLFLMKYLSFSPTIALFGGVLFITLIANTETLVLPMLEPSSLFCSMLMFIALFKKSATFFVLTAIIGIATKEVFVVSSILWFAVYPPSKKFSSIVHTSIIVAVPIAFFAIIRTFLAGHAFEVNYGYNLLAGEFPDYGMRLLSFGSFIHISILVFLSFSFLWIGLIRINFNQIIFRSSIIIPIVVIAAILFSGRIPRVLGILFPIIIPSFLFMVNQIIVDRDQLVVPNK